MREIIRRTQVDKTVKVFNVGDEFLMHVFQAHLKANMCQLLKVATHTDSIPHRAMAQKHSRYDCHYFNNAKEDKGPTPLFPSVPSSLWFSVC